MNLEKSDNCVFCRGSISAKRHLQLPLSKTYLSVCEDYLETGKPCKHIFAVNFLLNLPAIILANREAAERKCPYCQSNNAVRNGKRYNKRGATQLFTCAHCNRTFRDELLPNSGA